MTCPPSLMVLPSAGRNTALAAACPHLPVASGRLLAAMQLTQGSEGLLADSGDAIIAGAAYPLVNAGVRGFSSQTPSSHALYMAVTVAGSAEIRFVPAPQDRAKQQHHPQHTLRLLVLRSGLLDPSATSLALLGPLIPFTLGDMNADGSVDLGVAAPAAAASGFLTVTAERPGLRGS